MKLLNVPPVKPGQKFKFQNGSGVYRLTSIEWNLLWRQWDIKALVVDIGGNVYRNGETIEFYADSDDVVEILND